MRGRSLFHGRVLAATALLAGALGALAGSACSEEPRESLCGVGQCGVDGLGGYCNVCATMIPHGPFSASDDHDGLWPWGMFPTTYCNEQTRQCEVVEARCQDGWCRVPAGSYLAGAGNNPYDFDQFSGMRPPHVVVLTRPYLVKQTPVTRAEWRFELNTSVDPSPMPSCGETCPVTWVSLFDAVEFANAMSRRDGRQECYRPRDCDGPDEDGGGRVCASVEFIGADCSGYRLPTEAELEFAASAGSVLCFSDGRPIQGYACDLADDMAADLGWYCANSDLTTPDCSWVWLEWAGEDVARCRGLHPVGQKRANRFGIFDINGNVGEYTGTRWQDAPPPGGLTTRYAESLALPTMTGSFDPHDQPVEVDPGHSRRTEADDRMVLKGGTYVSSPAGMCSYFRTDWPARLERWNRPGGSYRLDFVGFRLVRTLTPEEDAAWLEATVPEPASP